MNLIFNFQFSNAKHQALLIFNQFSNFKFQILNSRGNEEGFTLLEVLLSISIVAVLTGLSIPVFNSLQIQSDLDIATLSVAENLRRAQFLSQSVEGDSQWGIKVEAGTFTLFKGSSYIARDSDFDETTSTAGVITPSGDMEIVFNKLTGDLASAKSLSLISLNSTSKTVTLNEKGIINY